MLNKITPEHIQEIMSNRVVIYTKHVTTPTNYVEATAWLDNQYLLATAISKSVDPSNFDLELGKQYSSEEVHAKAMEKLWEMEGYLLHNQLHKERTSTYLTRLQEEYVQVRERASKLAAFIQAPKPAHITDDDWADLHEQYQHQSNYESTLWKRLNKAQQRMQA